MQRLAVASMERQKQRARRKPEIRGLMQVPYLEARVHLGYSVENSAIYW